MTEKLPYYDILGVVVPGTVSMGGLLVLLHWAGIQLPLPVLPSSIAFFLVIVVALFVGNLVQSIASFLEPLYFWTWGGNPSDELLNGRTSFRGISAGDGRRIAGLLRSRAQDSDREEEHEQPSAARLFFYANALVNRKKLGRAAAFNALYAYHRALLTMSMLLFLSDLGLCIHQWVTRGEPPRELLIGLGILAAVVVLSWFRAKQRGYYFVREVLQMAELELGAGPGNERS